MRELSSTFLAALACLTAGCSPEMPQESAGDPTQLQTLPGGDVMVATEYSFCDLLGRSTLVGRYAVERIESNLGTDLTDPTSAEPYPVSHVVLVGTSWSGSTDTATIKQQGGITASGRVVAAEVGFDAGEEVIAFLGVRWPDDTWRVQGQRILRSTSDGAFASEWLFGRGSYTAADIEVLVEDALDAGCVEDVMPNSAIDRASRDSAFD